MHRLRALIVALAMMCGIAAAVAQQPAPPPAGLSQQQFDQLVESITKAVREQVAREPGVKPAASAAAAPAPAAIELLGDDPEAVKASGVFDRFLEVLAAAPTVPSAVGGTLARLVGEPGANGGVPLLLLRLAIAAAVLVGFVALVRRLTARMAHIAFDGEGGYGRRTRVMLAVGVDLIRRGAPVVLLYALVEFWLRADVLQQRLIIRTIATVVFWWLIAFPITTALRPRHPELRLVRLGDRAAEAASFHLHGILLAGVATINYLRMLLNNGAALPAIQFVALAIGLAIGIWMAVAILTVRTVDREERAGRRTLWPWAFGAVAAVLWVSWTLGVLNKNVTHFEAEVFSLAVIASAWVVDATVGLAIGRQVHPDAAVRWWRDVGVLRVLRRFVRVAAFVVVGSLIVQTWIVDMLGVVSDERWDRIRAGLSEAGVILIVGYLGWEALRIFVDRKLARTAPQPGVAADKEDEEQKSGSRFQTMLPVIRIFAGIGIGVITVLFALSQIGMNIGPLIAGASIFGLAISFGSQTLVRDIVSGIFFMGDDAFRIGEYIDTGRLKGTVEGITLRSIRLRHQSGQVHTVPFGQIQSVTNFSRDWSTMKFNLRLARDTDLEKVRKITKKVGAAMLEVPELKSEFIEPMKMQGVADIEPTALVVRFKFTVKPVKPTWVRREAVKRLLQAFKDNGVEFASGAVTVQTLGGGPADVEAAGAAAAARTAPAASPAG